MLVSLSLHLSPPLFLAGKMDMKTFGWLITDQTIAMDEQEGVSSPARNSLIKPSHPDKKRFPASSLIAGSSCGERGGTNPTLPQHWRWACRREDAHLFRPLQLVPAGPMPA